MMNLKEMFEEARRRQEKQKEIAQVLDKVNSTNKLIIKVVTEDGTEVMSFDEFYLQGLGKDESTTMCCFPPHKLPMVMRNNAKTGFKVLDELKNVDPLFAMMIGHEMNRALTSLMSEDPDKDENSFTFHKEMKG